MTCAALAARQTGTPMRISRDALALHGVRDLLNGSLVATMSRFPGILRFAGILRKPSLWRGLVCALFLLALLLPSMPGVMGRSHHHNNNHTHRHGMTRAAIQKRRHHLKAILHQKRSSIQVVRARVEGLVVRGKKLSEQIHDDEIAEEDASARLQEGQQRLGQIVTSLQESQQKLEAAKLRLARDRTNLKRRLRDVYEQGNVGILQVLLNSRNIIDFMNRREYARRVVQRDLSIVKQVRVDENEIAAETKALAAAKAEKAREVGQIQYETERLSQAIANRTQILQATEQEAEAARESVSEMDAESANIQQMLQQLQSIPVLTIPGIPGGRQYKLHWAGRWVRPAEGRITSPFGYRYHPILHVYKLHTGVDIGAPYGASVRAAASGVVVHASWLGAYGNGIIIAHGDGLATLYGHLSHIGVSVGQEVHAGQVIGRVGATGLATGPHLHFEVRKYGTPVPPF